MRVLVWNINQQSGRNQQDTRQEIPGFVEEEILNAGADVIVLTEFMSATNQENIQRFKAHSRLNDKYELYCNEERDKKRQKANGILIAVKNGFAEFKSPANEIINTSNANDQPNFLQLDIEVNAKPISIIGVRIKVGGGLTRSAYLERHRQLSSLIEHIKTLDTQSILVAGDFNNAYIPRNRDYSNRVTDGTYNYHIMQNDFADVGMTVYTPDGEHYSCGFKLINHETKVNCGYLKEDHIIAKGLIVTNPHYCHSFMKDYEVNKEWKRDKGEYIIAPPYPDHAILTADVDL